MLQYLFTFLVMVVFFLSYFFINEFLEMLNFIESQPKPANYEAPKITDFWFAIFTAFLNYIGFRVMMKLLYDTVYLYCKERRNP